MPIRSDRFPALFASRCFRSFCTVALYWRAVSLHPFSLKGATFIDFLSKMQTQCTSECLGLSHPMPVILLTEVVSQKNSHPCFTTMFPSNDQCFHWNLESLQIGPIFWRLRNHLCVWWVDLGPKKATRSTRQPKKNNGRCVAPGGFHGFDWMFFFFYVGIFNEHHINNGGNTAECTLTTPSQVNFWRCGPSFSFWQLFNSAKGIEHSHHLLKGCRNKAFFKRPTVACWWLILRTDRQYSLFSCKKADNLTSTFDYDILRGTGTLWGVPITILSS